MKERYLALKKQYRFYFFIITAFFMLMGMILECHYLIEYKNIEKVIIENYKKDTYTYTYKDNEGKKKTKDIYYCESSGWAKWDIMDILDDKLGNDFVKNTYVRGHQIFILDTIPFLVSLLMCGYTMLSDKTRNKILEHFASSSGAPTSTCSSSVIDVECPYCHSHNTKKISSTSKAVNTAMFGVFGQKRKHQWHCNKCKSDF